MMKGWLRMGRVKKNRPRRVRGFPSQPLSLYEMRPGGSHYTTWIDTSGVDVARIAASVKQSGVDNELLNAMPFYREMYGRWVPGEAVTALDGYLEDGRLPFLAASGCVALMPLEQFLTAQGMDVADLRASLHGLHALGMVLVDNDGVVYPTIPPTFASVRLPGSRREERVAPSGPWGQGDPETWSEFRLCEPAR
jgi:hypothetical protein